MERQGLVCRGFGPGEGEGEGGMADRGLPSVSTGITGRERHLTRPPVETWN